MNSFNLEGKNNVICDVESDEILQDGLPDGSSPSEHQRGELLIVGNRHDVFLGSSPNDSEIDNQFGVKVNWEIE